MACDHPRQKLATDVTPLGTIVHCCCAVCLHRWREVQASPQFFELEQEVAAYFERRRAASHLEALHP